MTDRARFARFAAIALVSATVMLYEITITRILSVVLWYHFGFLAVSLAMLGLGVPGVWLALRPAGPRTLERALLVATAAVPLSLIVLLQFGGPLPVRAAWATACLAAPMLALGTAVCVLLLEAPGRAIGRMYAADLLGATAGAFAIVPLLRVVPTPALVAGSAALPALALVVLGRRRAGLVALAALALLLAWPAPLRIRHEKEYSEKDLDLRYEKWTPTARLTVIWRPHLRMAVGWGWGTKHRDTSADQLWLDQDGSAGTVLTRRVETPDSLDYLLDDVTSVGYQVRKPDTACVIGAGGGRDILTALVSGARSVDAVEINPGIVDLVSRRFGDFTGDVYHRPGVRPIVGEGRSVLTATGQRYDLIQISLIDSWAATAAGAYAFSENFLYTVDAYRLYWNRLAPGGMIPVTRWITVVEALRLAHLTRAALVLEGVTEPERHLAIVGAGRMATVLASREPFAGAFQDSLDAVCMRRGFFPYWPRAPWRTDPPSTFFTLLQQGPTALRERGIDLSVPNDDRPFFFQSVAVFGPVDREAARTMTHAQPVFVLRTLMLLVGAAALTLFFLPFALRRALPRGPGFWRGSAYFALIGLGFMAIEIPTVQRLVLFLGHPSYAITIGLAGMLLGAGLGALASARVRATSFTAWPLLVPLVAAAVSIGFQAATLGAIGWPWTLRAAFAFAAMAAIGLPLGFGLPLGMVRFGDEAKAWFWAVNGFCGVVASVCSLGLAMTFGFAWVIRLGLALYVAAALVLWGRAAAAAETPAAARS